MSAKKRDECLLALEQDEDTTVMLASLGVCAVGLNLTAANNVSRATRIVLIFLINMIALAVRSGRLTLLST